MGKDIRVTVYLDRDELYPVYAISKGPRMGNERQIKVLPGFIARYRKAELEWGRIQKELHDQWEGIRG